MNTAYYKEFVILAEEKNYMEAAERLFMSQSTLSKHIMSMEKSLGVPLFQRSTRRVELTDYGKTLLPYAQNISKLEYEYSSLMLQMKNQEEGLLMLGSIPSMAQYGIISLLADFQKEYSQNRVKVIEEDSKKLVGLLSDKKCELIFLRESAFDYENNDGDRDELVRIPYVEDHLVAVLPLNHPLSQKEQVTLREIKDEHFCLLKEGTMLYDLCVHSCHLAGFIPEITFTSHRIESIWDMVSAGNHVALLTNYHVNMLSGEHSAGNYPLAVVKIIPEINSQIYLCYLKAAHLSKSAKKFLKFFRERCMDPDQEMIEEYL